LVDAVHAGYIAQLSLVDNTEARVAPGSNVQTADDMYTTMHVELHTTTKTTTNKKKDDNDCSGIMGKPSCSAVQLGRKDKPWPVWLEPLLSISTCYSITLPGWLGSELIWKIPYLFFFLF
jgi:hypothetical protein